MNWKIFGTGVIGGVLLAMLLDFPLYPHVSAPEKYIEQWINTQFAGLGLWLLLAGVLVLATGALAGWLSGLSTRRGNAGAGAIAGLITALIAEIWMGAATAGIWGSRTMLGPEWQMAQESTEATYRLVSGAVVSTYWWTYLSVWVFIGSGLLLGACAGFCVPPGKKQNQPFSYNPNFWLAVTTVGFLVSSICVILILFVFKLLVVAVQNTADIAGYQLPYPAESILDMPMLTAFVLLVFWQVIGWLLLRRVHHLPSTARQQRDALLTTWLYGILPFLLCIFVLVVDPGVFTSSLSAAAGMLVALGLGGLTLKQAWFMQTHPVAPTTGQPAFDALAVAGLVLLCGELMLNIPHLTVALAPINVVSLITPVLSITDLSEHILKVPTLVEKNYQLHRSILNDGSRFILVIALLAGGTTWFIQRWRTGRSQ